MGKQGSTKESIIKLIAEGNNTLSGIARSLNLASSTVSKHIDDLERAGIIEQVENPHIKKWKYYRIAQNPGSGTSKGLMIAANRNRLTALAATAVLLTVLLSLYVYSHVINGTSYVPIGITDPPQVPQGTQSLYINYSGFAVHVYGNGVSKWVPINASGRLDLMGLINVSQVIGGVSLGQGSSIDAVEFNITSAEIVINGTAYPVRVDAEHVMASLESAGVINSSSGILLDFSPVVTTLYSQNSTTFAMLPSLRAGIIPGSGFGPMRFPGNYSAGHTYPLPGEYRGSTFWLSNDISASNATISINGNSISFGVSLTNSGDVNVTVLGIMLQGQGVQYFVNGTAMNGIVTINVSQPPPQPSFNGTWGSNHQPGFGQQYPKNQIRLRVFQENGSNLTINASAIYALGTYTKNRSLKIELRNPASNMSISGFGHLPPPPPPLQGVPGFYGLGFIVEGNGTLYQQMPGTMPGYLKIQPGYIMAPHSSKEFTYNGTSYQMQPNQDSYRVMVLTNGGIATANATVYGN